MLQRAIIYAAVINFLLAAYLVFNIVSFTPDETGLNLNNPNTNTSTNTNQSNNGSKNNGTTTNSNTDNKDNNKNNDGKETTSTTSTKDILNEEELKSILESRNPFGISPIVDKTYQQKEEEFKAKQEQIQKEIEEQKAKEAQEGKTGDTSSNVDNGTTPTGDGTSVDNNGDTSTSDPGTGATTDNNLYPKKLTKEEAKKVADTKAAKYDIPVEWVMAIIEGTSQYKADLVTNDNNVSRRGLMQYREDKARFIAESIGTYYRPSLDFNPTMNIEMGAYYLGYLKKQVNDPHYVFTSYYQGEESAKSLKASKGSYESEFSKKIVSLTKNM